MSTTDAMARPSAVAASGRHSWSSEISRTARVTSTALALTKPSALRPRRSSSAPSRRRRFGASGRRVASRRARVRWTRRPQRSAVVVAASMSSRITMRERVSAVVAPLDDDCVRDGPSNCDCNRSLLCCGSDNLKHTAAPPAASLAARDAPQYRC